MGLTFDCIRYLKYIVHYAVKEGSQDSLYVHKTSYRTVKGKTGTKAIQKYLFVSQFPLFKLTSLVTTYKAPDKGETVVA